MKQLSSFDWLAGRRQSIAASSRSAVFDVVDTRSLLVIAMDNQNPMVAVRRTDTAELAEMLARSFVEDPGLAWLLPDEATRRACLPGFFRAIIRGTRRNGLALRAPNNAAVSLWRLPGSTYPGILESLVGIIDMLPFLKHAARRAQILAKAVQQHAPSHPFRYLQFVGVAPESQGQGLGGAAIRAGLQAAANAGQAVYLETPNPKNVHLYLHHGFEIINEWTVEPGSLHFTSMAKR